LFFYAPILSSVAKKVSKEARSTASSLTAVKFPHSEKVLAKNAKLALLKQLHFFNAKTFSAFGSAEVLPLSSGNALMNSEAKASVLPPRQEKACYV